MASELLYQVWWILVGWCVYAPHWLRIGLSCVLNNHSLPKMTQNAFPAPPMKQQRKWLWDCDCQLSIPGTWGSTHTHTHARINTRSDNVPRFMMSGPPTNGHSFLHMPHTIEWVHLRLEATNTTWWIKVFKLCPVIQRKFYFLEFISQFLTFILLLHNTVHLSGCHHNQCPPVHHVSPTHSG